MRLQIYDDQKLQKATLTQTISKENHHYLLGKFDPKTFRRQKKGLCPQELFVFYKQTQVCRWDPVSGLPLDHKNKKAWRTLSRLSDRLSLGVPMAGVTLNLLHVHRHKESGP